MKIKNSILVSFIALLALLMVAGCATPAPVYAEGEAKDKAVATADPLAKDIFDGIQQNDFALYTKDFDEGMLKASTKESFDAMIKQFAPYGNLKSSELINVQIVSTYYRVNYKLTFDNTVITMGVVIPNDGTAKVSGLWFK
ncbi:MAG: DUF3887 domain-containing protein [Anaerolineaceae bacterium]